MNTGSSPKKFRNSIGGYHKDDVNAYIKEIDLQHSARVEELQNLVTALTAEKNALLAEQASWQATQAGLEEELQKAADNCAEKDAALAEKDGLIKDLQKRMDVCRAQTEAQNTVIDKLRSEKEASGTKITSLSGKLQSADTAAAALRTELAEKAAQLKAADDALEAKKQEMDAAVAAANARAAEELARLQTSLTEDEDSAGYKVRMYDQISGQIGDILLGANRSADDILDSAQEEADRMRTEAAEEMEKSRNELNAEMARLREETQKEALYIRERLSETAQSMLADISGELHTNMDNCIKELATCMAEVEYDAETMLQTMQKRCTEMNDRIQYYQGCVQESVSAKLCAMDQKYGIPKAGN